MDVFRRSRNALRLLEQIIHRDVKSLNVLLRERRPGVLEACIADFGAHCLASGAEWTPRMLTFWVVRQVLQRASQT